MADDSNAESTLESTVHESKGQIDDLLKSLGLTPQSTMSQFSEALTKSGGMAPQQSGSGGLSGFLEAIPHAAERTLHDIGPANPIAHALFRGVYEGHPDAKKATKKTTAASPQSEALSAIQQYLTSMAGGAETAAGVEGQQLAQQNAAVTSTVDQYIGGGGVASGNPAVDAAMGAYQKAYSAGEGLNSAAYANMGAANAQFLQAAPEQSVVNLLTQGLGSGQYKELPPSLVNSLPESVRQALSQAGITETTGSGAGTPIPTGKGSTSASSNIYNLLNGIQQQGRTGAANPLSGINPPATTTNPNTPGA